MHMQLPRAWRKCRKTSTISPLDLIVLRQTFSRPRIVQKKVRKLRLGENSGRESARPNKALKQTVPPLAGPPFSLGANAAGLRTAFRWCDLGAELPHLADCRRIHGRLWTRRGIRINTEDPVLQSGASSSRLIPASPAVKSQSARPHPATLDRCVDHRGPSYGHFHGWPSAEQFPASRRCGDIR